MKRFSKEAKVSVRGMHRMYKVTIVMKEHPLLQTLSDVVETTPAAAKFYAATPVAWSLLLSIQRSRTEQICVSSASQSFLLVSPGCLCPVTVLLPIIQRRCD